MENSIARYFSFFGLKKGYREEVLFTVCKGSKRHVETYARKNGITITSLIVQE